MAKPEPRRRTDDRRFWLRLALTTAVVAFPLAYGFVILEVSAVATLIVALASAIALLAIWDASRHLPSGWMFWSRPEALQDTETGVFNPGAWQRHLAMEEDRCGRHQLEAAVIAVRLREPPAEPATVGGRLSAACRAHDIVACLDERTFGVLAIATDRSKVTALVRRIEESLRADGVRAEISAADRTTSGSLPQAWAAAALEATS